MVIQHRTLGQALYPYNLSNLKCYIYNKGKLEKKEIMVKKQILLICFLFGIFQILVAEEPISMEISEHNKNLSFYAGINPIALVAFLPDGIGSIGTAFGYISGQEFGISLYGGMHFSKAHSVEMRFSTGPATYALWDTQIQLGYIWYPLEQFFDWNGGLLAGLMLRQFFWHHRMSDYITYSFSPEVLLGWRFKVKSLAIDLRAGWNMTAVTWSDMQNSKEVTKGTLVPPYPFFTAGIAWIF